MGMHKGMDGQHVFAIDIRSNDPNTPVKTLRWSFLPIDIGWKSWMRDAD